MAIATAEARSSVTQLYVALFGRAPDAEGLEFWAARLDEGLSVTTMANTMLLTTPARVIYPDGLDNGEIVTAFYVNVLGRPPDAQGLAFWSEKLSDSNAGAGAVIGEMINVVATYSAPDDTPLGALGNSSKDLFNNRVVVAQHFAEQGGTVENATKILDAVTADPDSVDAAIKVADELAAAPPPTPGGAGGQVPNPGGGGDDGPSAPPAPLPTQVFARAQLDASAIDPVGGDMYSGSGNLVTGFQVARADSVGLELALKGKIRGGADGTGDGPVYYVPSGTSAPDRAKWSVDFSIAADTDHNGDVLGRYTYKLLVDVDKSAGTDFKAVDVLHYAPDHSFTGGALNPAAAGKAVLQNSFNLGFSDFQALFGATPYDFGAGQFDFKLQALDAGTVVMENSIQVVAAIPAQTASMASLHPSAIDTDGKMYMGNGNPATGFHTVNAGSIGLELAIKAKDRATGTSTATDNVYSVATGTTGSSAKWNIDFSIAGDTDHNGSALGAYAFRLLVDVDATAATRYVTLDALHDAPDNNFHNVGGVQVLNTAAGANAVEQNSFNLGFNSFRQLFDDPATTGVTEAYAFGNGRFDVKLQALDLVSGNVMLENAIVVLVGTGAA